MDQRKDYYATLGVLPSAEDVVIRAAYRALAQRYHPDRATQDPAEANLRMAELNEAYAVLSDPNSRKVYDSARGSGAQSADAYFSDAQDKEFTDPDPLEGDWNLAKSYFPDLLELERRLAKVSWRLAFTFRAHLLDTKQFQDRKQIADASETQFLQTYFGTNPKIVRFARALITAGHKAPARALNEAIRVLGLGIEAESLIARISSDYNLQEIAETDRRNAENRRLAEKIQKNSGIPVSEKIELLQRLGGRLDWDKGFFRSSCQATFNEVEYKFADWAAFSQWIDRDIVPQVLTQ